jgi:putative transcriptional regulator
VRIVRVLLMVFALPVGEVGLAGLFGFARFTPAWAAAQRVPGSGGNGKPGDVPKSGPEPGSAEPSGNSATLPRVSAGQILISTPASRDPSLAQTVILIIQSSPEGIVGLVLNRPSDVPVSHLFSAAKPPATPVFRGGPIETGARGLLRSRQPQPDLVSVAPGVYYISGAERLKSFAERGLDANNFRIYAGYAGWSQAQMRSELGRRLWRLRRATPEIVFHPDPRTLWNRFAP